MKKLGSALYYLGLFMVPVWLYFDIPGWVAISYSILIGAKIIQEGK